MSRFSTSGIDELMSEIEKLDLNDEEMDGLLFAGAEEIEEAWKDSATEHDLIDTGDMIESTGHTKPKSVDGAREVDIYPLGKDRKGVRNAEKAFINHYGTSKIKATHFVDEAEENAADNVQQAMGNEYDRLVEKKG